MACTAIGTAMIEVMRRYETDNVIWGDVGVLDDVFSESGTKSKAWHPLLRHQVVLNALERDERFEKFYIRLSGHWTNPGARRLRGFKLIHI